MSIVRNVQPVHIELDIRSEVNPSMFVKRTIARNSVTFTHYNYINLTNTKVRIKDRMGITRTIETRGNVRKDIIDNSYKNRSVILIEIAMGISCHDTASVLHELEKNRKVSYLSQRLYERVLDCMTRNAHAVVDLIFEIPRSVIQGHGGVVYIPELDITIECGLDDSVFLEHPADPGTKHQISNNQLASTIANLNENTLIVAIDAVDNTGHDTVRDKYVTIAGKVYKLLVRRERDSIFHGVRVRRRGCIEDGDLADNFTFEEYSFNEAATILGVSDTVEEAMCHGDSKEATTRKNLLEAERLKQLEHSFQDEKRKFELDQMEIKRKDQARQDMLNAEKERIALKNKQLDEEIANDKRRLEQLRLELERLKQRDDMKRESTRTVLDTTKTVAAILAGIVATVTAFNKLGEFFTKVAPT